MIIGIDCSRAFTGQRTGTENYSYYVIKHLLRLPEVKTHHLVLFTRPNALIPEWARTSFVELVPIKQKYFWTQLGLAKETWERELDVLWIPAHTLPVLRKPGLKTVVTIHGLEYKWLPEYKNLLQRWYLPLSTYYAARSATRLIAVSQFTKKQLLEETKIRPDKVGVIYEGSENSENRKLGESEFRKTRTKYQIEDKKYILFVGTLQPRKNLAALIGAYSRFKSHSPDIKLVITGGKGWLTSEIFQAPARYGVQESVIFTGRVDERELEALYRGALLYVQPSIQEGFGLPVIEAMRLKVPVVVSAGGALPEVVSEGGMVIGTKGFGKKLAAALTQLASEPKKRARLVSAGTKRVEELSWQKAAKATWEVLTNFG